MLILAMLGCLVLIIPLVRWAWDWCEELGFAQPLPPSPQTDDIGKPVPPQCVNLPR